MLAFVGGATLIGFAGGRYLREHSAVLREPFGVLQAALLGVVGLLLAFGLSLAVDRYQNRRAALVEESNAIGTTYLRAQLIAEPQRSESLALLRRYTTLALRISHEVPNSDAMRRTTAAEDVVQRRLWRLAGQAIAAAPLASAPRLYVDSLNSTIDQQTVRLSALANRVPSAVLAVELIGAAVALGLLAVHISLLGRGLWPMLAAAALVTMLLLVTFDLDRPTRGLIQVPDTPLKALRASMLLPRPRPARSYARTAMDAIAPQTTVGAVHLTVSDLTRSLDYYRGAVGLGVLEEGAGQASLGADGRELLVLVEERGARRAAGHTGLYHFALLVPERAELAAWLAHAARDRVPLVGLSDHFVSEALYLSDPDGHGIEIYRDRPREIWEDKVGSTLTTMPLDVDDLLAVLDDPETEPFDRTARRHGDGARAPQGGGIPPTIDFYRDVLGFGLTAQLGEQAAFLSAGGYHHHVGANTWESARAPRRHATPPPSGTPRSCFPTTPPATRSSRASKPPASRSRTTTAIRSCGTRRATLLSSS